MMTVLFMFSQPWETACAFRITWSVFQKDAEYFRKVQSDPVKLVKEFCESEFNGAQDIRVKVAKFTVMKEANGKDQVSSVNEENGRMINFSTDAIVVVDSYKIQGIHVNNGHAEATVVYKRLANSSGISGRRYMVDRNDRDFIRLSLDYDGTQWWIKDPPLPRVSKWALIEFSERIISSMDDLIKKGKASEGQKKYYLNNKDIVIFLRSL